MLDRGLGDDVRVGFVELSLIDCGQFFMTTISTTLFTFRSRTTCLSLSRTISAEKGWQ